MKPLSLENGSKILVVGGGPGGAFFAITMLREARKLGREVEVVILERRQEAALCAGTAAGVRQPSCSYCAGGISPRMSDVLAQMGLEVPPEIILNRISSITIQSHWKNLEIPVPEGRKMFSVYRGSRPTARADRYVNFDSFLLEEARKEGAKVMSGEVTGIARSESSRPRVSYLERGGSPPRHETIEADFLVFAGGINQVPGMKIGDYKLVRDLQRLMPGFVAPKIRRTLIFELDLTDAHVRSMEGELYFILYGSRDLRLELGSLMPKGRFITVALIGKGIDRRLGELQDDDVVRMFLAIPNVNRVLPRAVMASSIACLCNPNMVIGGARRAFGDRVAVVGDMVTSRLYKDGIYSSYRTASALVDAALKVGIDSRSLQLGYWPVIRRLNRDNVFGRLVFLCNALAFRHPILSRVTYQAILWERKTTRRQARRLETILWRIASGDDSYRSILRAMFSPSTVLLLLVWGLFMTIRNFLTELLFGVSWKGLGRHPTGVHKEEFEAKEAELGRDLGISLGSFRDFKRMYSIRVKAPRSLIFGELGRFGEMERSYFKPRLVDVKRTAGAANQIGSIIRYDVALRPFSFSMVLERRTPDRRLAYRVRDGFGKGGIFVFDIEDRGSLGCLLSIFVTFQFHSASHLWGRVQRFLLKMLFPRFVHDVLWNHSLCKFKDSVERMARRGDATSCPGRSCAFPDCCEHQPDAAGQRPAIRPSARLPSSSETV